MADLTATRRCESCPAVLSSYNKTTTCGPCRHAASERRAAAVLAAPDFSTVEQRIMEILRVVQASVSDLVHAIGCSDTAVRSTLLRLIESGRVARGPKRDGARRYMLADEDDRS